MSPNIRSSIWTHQGIKNIRGIDFNHLNHHRLAAGAQFYDSDCNKKEQIMLGALPVIERNESCKCFSQMVCHKPQWVADVYI